MRRIRPVLWGLAIVLVIGVIALFLVVGCGCSHTMVTNSRFAALRADHTALRAFLGRMPKGADLHVHLSGAPFAEDMIAWALERKLCYWPANLALARCTQTGTQPLADFLDPQRPDAQSNFDRLVNALSMRNYLPSPAVPSGHDQFFATFGRFGAITELTTDEMIAERLHHYAADQVQHTELMVSFLSSDTRRQYVGAIDGVADPAERLVILRANGLDEAVKQSMRQLDGVTEGVSSKLGCGAEKPDPGCNVTYRYIAQINRNTDEANVFVQTAFAAALVRADPRVVGLNFVGPEDYRTARADYRKHMAMIGFLTGRSSGQSEVPVALHAGELWIGLVPPDDLTFHIREAVEVAGAKRIGHGVALAFEKRSGQLLEEMRTRNVAVEINLTSNDVILGVRGRDHPLPAYRAARVPVVLSTDDAGVSRIDLTNEYLRAARDYPLTYRELKQIARASIEHAFLGSDAKRQALEELDKSMVAFEKAIVAEGGVWRNIGAVLANPRG
jgi:adenosine deaminase